MKNSNNYEPKIVLPMNGLKEAEICCLGYDHGDAIELFRLPMDKNSKILNVTVNNHIPDLQKILRINTYIGASPTIFSELGLEYTNDVVFCRKNGGSEI